MASLMHCGTQARQVTQQTPSTLNGNVANGALSKTKEDTFLRHSNSRHETRRPCQQDENRQPERDRAGQPNFKTFAGDPNSKDFDKRKCYFWFCLACKKHCCRCSSCSLRCCAPAHDLCIHARYKNLIGVLAHLGIKRELPPKNFTNIPINLSTTFPEPTRPFASGTGMSFNLLSLAALPVIPVLPAFRIGFDGLTPRDPKPSDSHCSRRHISWKIHSLWESLPWAKELQEN